MVQPLDKVPSWLSSQAQPPTPEIKPPKEKPTRGRTTQKKYPHIIGIGRVRFISLYALGMTFGFRNVTETIEYLEPLGIPITAIRGREYYNLEALENALDEATRSGGRGLSSKHPIHRLFAVPQEENIDA